MGSNYGYDGPSFRDSSVTVVIILLGGNPKMKRIVMIGAALALAACGKSGGTKMGTYFVPRASLSALGDVKVVGTHDSGLLVESPTTNESELLAKAPQSFRFDQWAPEYTAYMFLIIYVPVIASEERFLRANFPDFAAYCQRVPRLLPRISPGLPTGGQTEVSSGKFSLDLYLRHREYNASIGTALLYLCLLFLRPALGLFLHLPQ